MRVSRGCGFNADKAALLYRHWMLHNECEDTKPIGEKKGRYLFPFWCYTIRVS